MNTARVKVLVWGAAAVVGAGVAVYVATFFKNRDEFLRPVEKERMQAVLEDVREVPQRTEDIVDAKLVERSKQFDWTARPEPLKPDLKDPEEVVAKREEIKDLLRVLAAWYDAGEPDQSHVLIKYTSDARVVVKGPRSDGTRLKRVGDVLDDRLSNIGIESIGPDGVTFRFLHEPERETELVTPAEYEWGKYHAVVQGDEFVVVPNKSIEGVVWDTRQVVPGRTEQLSPNKYRLGTEDVAYFDENYPKILTEEVEVGEWRDPKTRKLAGVQVKKIAPDSIAARHGVVEGDVIKSINGHPVASKDEAILFVKNNHKKYDEWVVEIWNKGQTRTLTYYSNQKK